jgi:integrase
MSRMKMFKTDYPGVFYILGRRAGKGDKEEKIYYIVYRRQGKLIHEKAGRQYEDDMTPTRAAEVRAAKIEGKELPNTARRRLEREARTREDRWTLNHLWDEYEATKSKGKALSTDEGRFRKYLKDTFGGKEPHEIVPLDIDRLKRRELNDKQPQTVKHVLGLLQRLVRFGMSRGVCQALPFKIEFPKVNNLRTEDLTSEQLQALLGALDASRDIMTANLMGMALYTGMRRGELFKLRWQDIDFERGFITIRNPKGGKDATVPLNSAAREVLLKHPRQKGQELVFYRGDGKSLEDINRRAHRIMKAAGITGDFRPLHGLRHHFASALASSGKVDLCVLQRLLTHKSPTTTQTILPLARSGPTASLRPCRGAFQGSGERDCQRRDLRGGRGMNQWLDGTKVMRRWKVDRTNLIQCIIDGLPIYDHETLTEIKKTERNSIA